MDDGDRQRDARLVLGRRPASRRSMSGSRSPRSLLAGRRGPDRHRRRVGRDQPARRSTPEEEIERVVPLIERVARRARGAGLGRHLQAGGGARGDRRRRGDRQRRERAARPGAGRRVRADRRRRSCSCTRARRPRRSCSIRRSMGAWWPTSSGSCASGSSWRSSAASPSSSSMLDPGPDFGKTPAQTVEVLRALPELHALGRPLLLAVSRKDFIGAITRPAAARAPRRNARGGRAGGGRRRPRAARPRCRRRRRFPGRAGGAEQARPNVDSALQLAIELRREPRPYLINARLEKLNRRSLAQRDRSPPIIRPRR